MLSYLIASKTIGLQRSSSSTTSKSKRLGDTWHNAIVISQKETPLSSITTEKLCSTHWKESLSQWCGTYLCSASLNCLILSDIWSNKGQWILEVLLKQCDASKYCEYYQDVRHGTNDYEMLQSFTKKLIAKIYLKKYLTQPSTGIASSSTPGQGKASKVATLQKIADPKKADKDETYSHRSIKACEVKTCNSP